MFNDLLIRGITIASMLLCVVFAASIARGQRILVYPDYKVSIDYADRSDAAMALSAIQQAYDFFSSLGYSEHYLLKIVFQKEVVVTTGYGDSIRVYGKLDKNNQIFLTRWSESWLRGQNSFGLKMSKAFYESLIVHELAHFIAKNITHGKIGNTLSEYIAYVVQLSQMQPDKRRIVLSQSPVLAFKTEEIHPDIMLLNPRIFSVKSYLHFKQGKGQYLKEILRGTFKKPVSIAFWDFH